MYVVVIQMTFIIIFYKAMLWSLYYNGDGSFTPMQDLIAFIFVCCYLFPLSSYLVDDLMLDNGKDYWVDESTWYES